MTVTPLNSYADFRNAVRRLISLRSRPTHILIIDRHGTIRSTRAKSSSLTSGLLGVARAESSRPSLSNCRKGLAQLSSIRSMWTSKIRSRRKSAFVLYVAPPLAPLVRNNCWLLPRCLRLPSSRMGIKSMNLLVPNRQTFRCVYRSSSARLHLTDKP
jgi:hypothetical protein